MNWRLDDCRTQALGHGHIINVTLTKIVKHKLKQNVKYGAEMMVAVETIGSIPIWTQLP